MTYSPGNVSGLQTVDDVRMFLETELGLISKELQETTALDLRPVFVAPERPRNGMIVYADGTNWNPGAGEGPYVYLNGAWKGISNSTSRHKTGTFTRDLTAATGSASVTGVGFKPRVIVFIASKSTGAAVGSVGWTDETQLRSLEVDEASPFTAAVTGNATVVGTAAADFQAITSVTMDSDGFTVGWTKIGTPTGTGTIFYLALE